MKQAPFVTTLDLSLEEKLKNDLLSKGFLITTPPYTLFLAKGDKVSCTLYESGKLVVQGKKKGDFIENYLEPEILGSFSYRYPHMDQDQSPHIGSDEAGKGDFFGPLVVAALYADKPLIDSLINLGIQESKKLSDKKIMELFPKIKSLCPHSIVSISPEKYNALYEKFNNLNSLLAWAHVTAIESVYQKTQCQSVLIDQFASEHVINNALRKKELSLEVKQRPRAEEDIVVAAASLLARGAFVEGIERMEKTWNSPFPKGASHKVVESAALFIKKFSSEDLVKVAKAHFKTRDDALKKA